jgi:uncharacterized protein
MPRLLRHFVLASLALCMLSGPVGAADAPQAIKMKQYLYVLTLVPRLHDDKAWTAQDNAALGAHFNRLKADTDQGKVILAGRTSEAPAVTLGLVVFEAENDAAARQYMETDPAVAGGQMTAKLHPYSVALMRKNPRGG